MCPADVFSMSWLEFLVTLRMEQPQLLQSLASFLVYPGRGSALHRLSQTFLWLLHGRYVSRPTLILLFLPGCKKTITYTDLFPLLFQLHKTVSTSLAFSDFFQSLFDAKGRQTGCKWTRAEPRPGQ